MIVEKVTRKSRRYNEDRFLEFKSCFMVMDGATSLAPTKFKPSGGSFLVSYLKNNLPKGNDSIIEKLYTLSKELSKYTDEKSEEYLPSAGLAWCEIKEDIVNIHTIGDCEVVVITNNGKIIRYVQPELIKLDSLAIKEMIDISKEKSISIKDARKYVNDMLIKHRKMMNKVEGYNVFAPYDNPSFKFLSASVEKKDVKYIYLFSDGFASAFDCFGIYNSFETMFKDEIDLKLIIDKIVNVAKSDPDYNLYPRFKLIDDITAIKIKM